MKIETVCNGENGKNFLIGALLIVILPSVISAFLYFDYTRLEGAVRDVAEWLISVVLLYIIGKTRNRSNFKCS